MQKTNKQTKKNLFTFSAPSSVLCSRAIQKMLNLRWILFLPSATTVAKSLFKWKSETTEFLKFWLNKWINKISEVWRNKNVEYYYFVLVLPAALSFILKLSVSVCYWKISFNHFDNNHKLLPFFNTNVKQLHLSKITWKISCPARTNTSWTKTPKITFYQATI